MKIFFDNVFAMLMAFGCRENLFHEPFLGSQNLCTASEKNLLEVTKQPHAATRDFNSESAIIRQRCYLYGSLGYGI